MWNPFNNSYIAENRINTVSSPQPETTRFVGTLGLKRYELCNHLGNVQAVITDRTLPHNNSGTIDFYIADLLSATDYYPFGMVLPGRSLETDKYRFGFNGKEFDKEWNSGEMTYDYGFRIYDPRIIRFLSVDPLTRSYPQLTPYQFASNTPIQAIDLDGLESIRYNNKDGEKYPQLKEAINLLIEAKVWQELTQKFANGNEGVDILISVAQLGAKDGTGTRQGITSFEALYAPNNKEQAQGTLNEIRSKYSDMDLSGSKELLRQKKAFIIVAIDVDLVKRPEENPEALPVAAMTIVHEIDAHAVQLKAPSIGDDCDVTCDHQRFYNDPSIRGVTSPGYSDIKPDSPAGKHKQKIEQRLNQRKEEKEKVRNNRPIRPYNTGA